MQGSLHQKDLRMSICCVFVMVVTVLLWKGPSCSWIPCVVKWSHHVDICALGRKDDNVSQFIASWVTHLVISFYSILQVTSGSMIANRSCQWSSMSKEGFPVGGVKGGSMVSLSGEGRSRPPSLPPTSCNWGTRKREKCWVLLNNRREKEEAGHIYFVHKRSTGTSKCERMTWNQTSPKLKTNRQNYNKIGTDSSTN